MRTRTFNQTYRLNLKRFSSALFSAISSVLSSALSAALISPFLLLLSVSVGSYAVAEDKTQSNFIAPYTSNNIKVDGNLSEDDWATAKWYPLDKHMLGELPTPDDFSGRFKLLWNKDALFLVAEITDDILFDQYPNPLDFYWDDDCLEIFIDEDKSGGNHQFNFNAFAYHVALDNQSVDIGEKTRSNIEEGTTPFILLNDHILSAWKRSAVAPHKITWEVAISVYDDTYKHYQDLAKRKAQKPVELKANKEMGFMLAYCDNDGSKTREHFIGSTEITPVNGDKNLGYIDSSVFSSLKLLPVKKR